MHINELLDLNPRYAATYKDHEIINFLLDPSHSSKEKNRELIKFARFLIDTDQQTNLALETIFGVICKHARETLFKQALGKTACDGGLYTNTYTEWAVIKDVESKMTESRKLEWVNFSNNPGYQKYYAPGTHNHTIFKEEMTFLATVLGLQIEEGCDFHKAITFTKKSSDKLLALGFGFDKNYIQVIKREIYKDNFVSFFARSQMDKETNQIHIKSLPDEMLDEIQNQREIIRVKP